MRHLTLSREQAVNIGMALEDAGYRPVEKEMYVRYSTSQRGESVFIHHSLDIIRCRKSTRAEDILFSILGDPNGKVPDSQDDGKMHTWFFNGYQGKSTTRTY